MKCLDNEMRVHYGKLKQVFKFIADGKINLLDDNGSVIVMDNVTYLRELCVKLRHDLLSQILLLCKHIITQDFADRVIEDMDDNPDCNSKCCYNILRIILRDRDILPRGYIAKLRKIQIQFTDHAKAPVE